MNETARRGIARRWRDVRMYARFATGFPALLRYRVTAEEAHAELRRRLATREEAFLRVVERGVFGHPASPYRRLFAHAGCTMGDLDQSVRSRGLEAALRQLREAGVYVAYEEFKGRMPIVRGGLELPVAAGDFDNPFLGAAYQQTSGGTTGIGTRVMIDLDNLRARAPLQLVEDEAHGMLGWPLGLWRGVLPDLGLNNALRRIGYGPGPERWFTPVGPRDLRPGLEFRLATAYVLGISRLCGYPLPRPEPVPLEQAAVVARWVAETLRARGRCALRAYVSLLVRVAAAAREEGLDLSGAVFGGGGEPPTPAKVAEITRCGARYFPGYSVSELGRVGVACTRPAELNDHHLREDHLAVVQHPRAVPGTSLEVDAFLFTTLLPSAPKLAINVESDDYGVLEQRDCGCPLAALGLRRHVRGIRSYRKLTAEGMTLVGSDVLRLLEEVLPARFGGSANDYQLCEEEDPRGFTRLVLRVSPRVARVDEAGVVDAVLEGLRAPSPASDLARATWRAAGSLRVRREEPVWTERGKLMPLDLAGARQRRGRG
ncbi:MAG: hypothetical protein KJ067_10420 [Vicinamibacteria bacterium]|nr:hypothetical protein [Vicinamibacteria bacterium]